MRDWLTIFKTVVKSSLDNCLVPGTFAGMEILLLYFHQWKGYVTLPVSTTLTLITEKIHFPDSDNERTQSSDDMETVETTAL